MNLFIDAFLQVLDAANVAGIRGCLLVKYNHCHQGISREALRKTGKSPLFLPEMNFLNLCKIKREEFCMEWAGSV